MFLLTHYRKNLEFSLPSLDASKAALKSLRNKIADLKDDKKTNKQYVKKFEDAVNDDLNMPLAIQVLQALLKDPKAQGKISTIKRWMKYLH